MDGLERSVEDTHAALKKARGRTRGVRGPLRRRGALVMRGCPAAAAARRWRRRRRRWWVRRRRAGRTRCRRRRSARCNERGEQPGLTLRDAATARSAPANATHTIFLTVPTTTARCGVLGQRTLSPSARARWVEQGPVYAVRLASRDTSAARACGRARGDPSAALRARRGSPRRLTRPQARCQRSSLDQPASWRCRRCRRRLLLQRRARWLLPCSSRRRRYRRRFAERFKLCLSRRARCAVKDCARRPVFCVDTAPLAGLANKPLFLRPPALPHHRRVRTRSWCWRTQRDWRS